MTKCVHKYIVLDLPSIVELEGYPMTEWVEQCYPKSDHQEVRCGAVKKNLTRVLHLYPNLTLELRNYLLCLSFYSRILEVYNVNKQCYPAGGHLLSIIRNCVITWYVYPSTLVFLNLLIVMECLQIKHDKDRLLLLPSRFLLYSRQKTQGHQVTYREICNYYREICSYYREICNYYREICNYYREICNYYREICNDNIQDSPLQDTQKPELWDLGPRHPGTWNPDHGHPGAWNLVLRHPCTWNPVIGHPETTTPY